MTDAPDSPALTASQLAAIAEVGEERTASEGDTLYRIGDERYPFIAILEGEVAVLDAAGNEITRHGPSKFLGEVNLLSGQAAFVTATATKPLRYIAVDREALRSLLFDDGPLSSLVLATFIARREALQQVRARARDRRPALLRADEAARGVRPRQPAAVHMAQSRAGGRPGRGGSRGRPRPLGPAARPTAGREWRCTRRRRASCRGRSASGASLRPAKRSTCSSSEPAPPGSAPPCTERPRASRRWSSRAPRSVDRPASRAGSRTTSAFRPGSPGAELTTRAVVQARKFGARSATPYRAVALRARRWAAHRPARGRRGDRRPAPCCLRPAPSTGASRSRASRTTRG